MLPPLSVGKMTLRLYGALNYSHGLSKGPSFGTGRGADEDRAKQLAAALAALDSNDENSLINRLVREIHRARQAVLNAVNPDALDSPMAIIKATLTDLLNEHARSQAEMLLAQQDQSRVSAHTRTSLYLSRATIYLTNHLLRSSLSR